MSVASDARAASGAAGPADLAAGGPSTAIDIVIPSIGRPSLAVLVAELLDQRGDWPGRIIVVDDRRHPNGPVLEPPPDGVDRVVIVASGGRGPAAARNAGWLHGNAPWIAFLDDDVMPRVGWFDALRGDVRRVGERTGATYGQVRVPLPADRSPTDAERSVAALASARWITADAAVRRAALVAIGGFDERFRRAYREDSDLALRLRRAGWQLEQGRRTVDHPVRRGTWWTSVRAQRGNADDALMARLHGRDWRGRAGAPAGTLRQHLATACLLGVATAALVGGRRRAWWRIPAAAWAIRTARFCWGRVASGPRSMRELARMAISSLLIPPAATVWSLWGRARARNQGPWRPSLPAAVLFDRDGTLIVDVPYNGRPEAVQPMPGAGELLARLRASGVAVGLITNQSGIARGLISAAQVKSVNERVEELLGPFATLQMCPHGAEDGCRCRKPGPGMVFAAADELRVPVNRCVVVGDTGADVDAAVTAGARAVLVPNERTRREEVATAPEVATDLWEVAERLLGDQPIAVDTSGSAFADSRVLARSA